MIEPVCAPRMFQPSKKACDALLGKISTRISTGKSTTGLVRQKQNSFAATSRYAQTLAIIDSVARGWGAFSYGNAPQQSEILIKRLTAYFLVSVLGMLSNVAL